MKELRVEQLGPEAKVLLERGEKAVVMDDGEAVGLLLPTPRIDPEQRRLLLENGQLIRAQLEAQGVTEEDIIADFAALRHRR